MEGRYVTVVIPGRKEYLTLCEVEVYGYFSLTAKNVALYGKATQSDLITRPWAGEGHAQNAIDGNRDPDYHHGSCAHTEEQTHPWWRVDLLRQYTITSVAITNRGDCCAGHINGAEIRIGNSLLDNGNRNLRAAVISSIPAGKTHTFSWDKGVEGRYVNVVLPGNNKVLRLCEVEVYGYPSPNGKHCPTSSLSAVFHVSEFRASWLPRIRFPEFRASRAQVFREFLFWLRAVYFCSVPSRF
ncbi:fucolectin-like [Clupea harengus]|uniref:Fucolectin-like n=1 Tax=Clupea harengus TaxID=7950 RepID=A0A8M1KGY2_CLUHA|nr:fucolectin-like [Clupea harengus]